MYKTENPVLNMFVKEVIHMKKAIKKITVIAMAFTLLGTGSFISNKTAPEKAVFTAHAITCPNCHGGSYWITSRQEYQYGTGGYFKTVSYCKLCGKTF